MEVTDISPQATPFMLKNNMAFVKGRFGRKKTG
jgi:hypothetical protein